MKRTIHGFDIQIGPTNKKVVGVGCGMVWMVRPGVFAAKAWNAPLSQMGPGNYHRTLRDAVMYAKAM